MKAILLMMSLALVAPAVTADPTTYGTPDFTCQQGTEMLTHDFGPAFTQAVPDSFVVPAVGLDENGEPVPRDAHVMTDYRHAGRAYGDFNLEECRHSTAHGLVKPYQCARVPAACVDTPMDFDGDMEYGVGGVVLAAHPGDGATWGSLACYGMQGHHGGWFSTVNAEAFLNDVLVQHVFFTLVSDHSRVGAVAGEPDCGDGYYEPCELTSAPPTGIPDYDWLIQSVRELSNQDPACNPLDQARLCRDSCAFGFVTRPGIDGAYHIVIHQSVLGNGEVSAGLAGHVWTT